MLWNIPRIGTNWVCGLRLCFLRIGKLLVTALIIPGYTLMVAFTVLARKLGKPKDLRKHWTIDVGRKLHNELNRFITKSQCVLINYFTTS